MPARRERLAPGPARQPKSALREGWRATHQRQTRVGPPRPPRQVCWLRLEWRSRSWRTDERWLRRAFPHARGAHPHFAFADRLFPSDSLGKATSRPASSSACCSSIRGIARSNRILIDMLTRALAQRLDVGKERGLGHDVISRSVLEADRATCRTSGRCLALDVRFTRGMTGVPTRTERSGLPVTT